MEPPYFVEVSQLRPGYTYRMLVFAHNRSTTFLAYNQTLVLRKFSTLIFCKMRKTITQNFFTVVRKSISYIIGYDLSGNCSVIPFYTILENFYLFLNVHR